MKRLTAVFLVLSALLLGTHASVAQPGDAGRMDIKTFVRQVFIQGVPYDEANQYTTDVVPTLLAMLADTAEEAHWANIAVVLEIIGDERAVEPLIAFIEQDVPGRMSRARYTAKTSALMGLGYLIHKTGNATALNYLQQSLDPETWESRKLTGISPFQTSVAERNRDLSKYAILGLALSGHPAAAAALQSLQQPAVTEAKRAFQAQINDVVSEALKAHADIAREGLAAYYEKSMP